MIADHNRGDSHPPACRGWSVCTQIIQQFIDRALNVFSLHPVDPETDGLPDYDQIAHLPMDLTPVRTNLEREASKSPHQWYRDMCLICAKLIKYDMETSFWGHIASQQLHDFKHAANGFETQTVTDWTDAFVHSQVRHGVITRRILGD
jgi:hypothetical protein